MTTAKDEWLIQEHLDFLVLISLTATRQKKDNKIHISPKFGHEKSLLQKAVAIRVIIKSLERKSVRD